MARGCGRKAIRLHSMLRYGRRRCQNNGLVVSFVWLLAWVVVEDVGLNLTWICWE